eukprot:93615_1
MAEMERESKVKELETQLEQLQQENDSNYPQIVAGPGYASLTATVLTNHRTGTMDDAKEGEVEGYYRQKTDDHIAASAMDREVIGDDEMSTAGADTGTHGDGEGHDEVRQWLQSAGFGQYYDNFVKNGMTELELIQTIEYKDDLNYLGITLRGHQIAIMKKINALNKGIQEDDHEDDKENERMLSDAVEEDDISGFDEMFVAEEEVRKTASTKSREAEKNDNASDGSHQQTTKDMKSFHGTKGDYYDEYNYQIHQER